MCRIKDMQQLTTPAKPFPLPPLSRMTFQFGLCFTRREPAGNVPRLEFEALRHHNFREYL